MAERESSVQIEHDPDSMLSESMFAVSSNGASAVVSATGELDLATRAAVRGVLAPLAGFVVVDLSHVSFLDSCAIGALVGARNRLLAGGGDLRLRAPREFVQRTLTTLGFADWIID
jgi:anti-sigma B factor antagonist